MNSRINLRKLMMMTLAAGLLFVPLLSRANTCAKDKYCHDKIKVMQHDIYKQCSEMTTEYFYFKNLKNNKESFTILQKRNRIKNPSYLNVKIKQIYSQITEVCGKEYAKTLPKP